MNADYVVVLKKREERGTADHTDRFADTEHTVRKNKTCFLVLP